MARRVPARAGTPFALAGGARHAHNADPRSTKISTENTPKRPGGILSKPPVSPGQGPSTASDPGSDAQLPHERDQSVGEDATGGPGSGAAGEKQRELAQRAHDDLAEGQVDTDMRATPGLDAERRGAMTRKGSKSTP